MDQLLKALSLLLIAAVLCVLLRQYHGVLAVLLSLAAATVGLALTAGFFQPVLDVAQELRHISGLSDTVTAPLVKITGVAVLSQCTCSVCEDSGEKTLAKTVELISSVCMVYCSLPLLRAVLRMLQDLLGG